MKIPKNSIRVNKMTKIGSKAAQQLKEKDTSYVGKNTKIEEENGNCYLSLHENRIVKLNENNQLFIRHCGWTTKTTKDRLGAVLSVFKTGLKIRQKDFKWFLLPKDEKIEKGKNSIKFLGASGLKGKDASKSMSYHGPVENWVNIEKIINLSKKE